MNANALGANSPLTNQADAEGTDGAGTIVTDLSDDGADPDGVNAGSPGDTGGTDDPTPIHELL